MSKVTKTISLIIALIVLIIIFTPIFGSLYERYLGQVSYGFFWGLDNPEYISGFFMSYAFFVPLILVLFCKTRKYLVLLILIGILLILDIVSGDGKAFLIDLITALIAFILAQIVLLIYRKFKK